MGRNETKHAREGMSGTRPLPDQVAFSAGAGGTKTEIQNNHHMMVDNDQQSGRHHDVLDASKIYTLMNNADGRRLFGTYDRHSEGAHNGRNLRLISI